MRVSLNWAQWHSKVDLKPNTVGDLVQKIGAQLGEVEGVYAYGEVYDGIYVVKVVSCEKHPDADKLSLCLVDDGGVVKSADRNQDGLVQVVCGAPNVRSGMLAAWIPPGSTVPSTYHKDPFVLEARELRGKVSNGMLASPSELDISDDHEGILDIDGKSLRPELATPGTPFKQLYGLDDVIIDIENKMFTHRPDCFGVLGVARELAGIQGEKFVSPDWYLDQPKFTSADNLPIKVVNELPNETPRFMAVAMSDVKVAPSPIWLQAGLRRLGIKSINNIVDITNYLMYLTGQPIHAYDYDKVKSLSQAEPTLVVRNPKKGEKIALLNGKTIEPRSEAIMIATDKELIGIGGVMGGTSTEVDDNTQNIIIECATFDLYSIRRTSMSHGLFTDAVTRFSKGQSPLQNDRVLAKAIELVASQASGKQASDVIDDKHLEGKVFGSASQIHDPVLVDPGFINTRLGLELSNEEIISLLDNVEFDVYDAAGQINFNPPFWRTDIAIPEDVVEEVGRLYGYDNLQQELPSRTAAPSKVDPLLALKQKTREILSSLGANETLNYSFVHGRVLENAGQNPDDSYKLNNALSPDLQYYRQSLAPSLLANVHANIKAGFDEFALFETNKTHNKVHGLDNEKVPGEINMLALTYASKSNKKGTGYFTAKEILTQLASKLRLNLEFASIEKQQDFPVTKPYDQTRSALVKVAGSGIFLGIVGEYKREVRKAFKLPAAAAGFEIGMDELMQAITKETYSSYKPLSRYPEISQDICLQVSPDTSYKTVYDLVDRACVDNQPEDVETSLAPLDIYVPESKEYKNITISIKLVSYQRTLQEDVASKLLNQVAELASKELGAKRV